MDSDNVIARYAHTVRESEHKARQMQAQMGHAAGVVRGVTVALGMLDAKAEEEATGAVGGDGGGGKDATL